MTEAMTKTIELMEAGMPISKALKEVYKTRKVSIPFSNDDFQIPVSELNISNRAYYALARTKLNTLYDAIHYINDHGYKGIKGLGVMSAEEVFEKILDVAWNKMSVNEQADFLFAVDNENEPK